MGPYRVKRGEKRDREREREGERERERERERDMDRHTKKSSPAGCTVHTLEIHKMRKKLSLKNS